MSTMKKVLGMKRQALKEVLKMLDCSISKVVCICFSAFEYYKCIHIMGFVVWVDYNTVCILLLNATSASYQLKLCMHLKDQIGTRVV